MFTQLRRLRARLKYRHFERDLVQELDVHREMKTAELEASGADHRDARATASRSLGNVTLMREHSRSVWIGRWLETTWQDVRYAARQLSRYPAYSIGATLILALGVATTTVAFSGINATLLRAWPVDDAGRLGLVKALLGPDGQFNPTTFAEAQYLGVHATTVSHMAAYMRGGAVLTDPYANVQSNAVTASYFEALRVGVTRGRVLSEDDGRAGAPPVGLISYRLWQTTFNGDPGIVGRVIPVTNGSMTIVGVVEPDFEDVHRLRIDLWIPLTGDPARPVNIVTRLANGVELSQSASELQGLSLQFRTANNLPASVLSVRNTRPINDPYAASDLRQFLLLLPVLGLVMVLVCANVGGLILARTSARQRELAVRLALGANRGRVARQVFTEVLVLAIGAGVLGIIASRLLPLVLSDQMRAGHFAPDALVFGMAFVLSVIAALLAAASALFRIRRITVGVLNARQHGSDRSGARARSVLIATQLAVSTAVLTGAGLMTRAVVHASVADPGFVVEHLETFRLASNVPTVLQAGRESLPDKWRRDVMGLGIRDVAFSSHAPISRSYAMTQIHLDTDHASTRRQVQSRSVSPTYFDVLGVRILKGTTHSETPGALEIVASEQAARWLWPDKSAVGQRLVIRNGDDALAHTVVGVVADVATTALGATTPTLYTPCGPCEVMVGRGLAPADRAQVSLAATALDPAVRVMQQTGRQNLMAEGAAGQRDAGTAAWLIGLSALALSLIGAFGVLAYTVEERRREIGIRMALGGRGWPVAAGVMATANRPACWGLGVGIVAAGLTATVLRHSIFGLTPFDPLAYGLVLLVLVPALALASVLPARRATRVNPAVTLRHD